MRNTAKPFDEEFVDVSYVLSQIPTVPGVRLPTTRAIERASLSGRFPPGFRPLKKSAMLFRKADVDEWLRQKIGPFTAVPSAKTLRKRAGR